MKTTDFETLSELALLLATKGWVIYEYKATGEESASLSIFRKKPEGEGKNG